MEERINIAELLRDCPKGMELYSTIYGTVYFERVKDTGNAVLIEVKTSCNSDVQFYPDGKFNTYYSDSEITLFPSKNVRTWEGFHSPLKDGDVCYLKTKNFEYIFIFKVSDDYKYIQKYVNLCGNIFYIDENAVCPTDNVKEIRFATEEEKEKLFQAIKDNGYKWNPETKTLEKLIEPYFKIGDKIKHKTYISQGAIVTEIKDTHYILNDESALPFTFQNEYELVPNKFDITTLVPFESRVLVRDTEGEKWKPAIWGYYDVDHIGGYPYETVGGNCFCFCIPYEGNKYLLGTTNDCDDYYKTWE